MQSLLDSSLDVICAVNREGIFVYVSAAAKRVLGYAPEELLGCRYLDFVVPEDRTKSIAATATILSGMDVTTLENRYIRKDGLVVSLLWSARWSVSEQLMHCVAKDISQYKQEQTQIKLLDRRLHRAYQLARIAWWEYNVETQTYTSSDEIFAMYGLPIPENNQTTLEAFLSYVYPEDRPRLQHALSTVCEETYIDYEHRILKPSGEIIYVIHYSEVIRDDKGYPVALHGTTKDITQQKMQQLELEASEKKLQQSTNRLTEIVESIGDGFFIVDKEWTVKYWNKKAEQLLHKKREEILGKNLWDEFRDAVSLRFFTAYHRAINENIVVQFEEYFSPLHMWIEVAAYPSAEGLTVYFKDITERKQQAEALRLANERFELAAKAASDVLWDWDIVSNTCYFNENFTALFGYANTADLVYKNRIDNIHEEDIKEVVESLLDAENDVAVTQWQSEYRYYRQDRSIAYILDRAFIMRNEKGKAIRVVGSMQDITKQKETEAELQKLSLVAKETVNAVVITDADEKITWVNKAFTDITEFSFDEAVGKSPGTLLQGPKTSGRTKSYLRKCVQHKRPFNCEILNYTKSGRAYWLDIKGQPIFGENGELKQFFAIQTDITVRKETEAILAQSEEKYKRLFSNSPQPKWIFHAESYRIIDVNEAACSLYGYQHETFLRLKIHDLKGEEDALELETAIRKLKTEKNGFYQKIVQHKKQNGKRFYIEITARPIQLNNGVHIIVIGTDMTEKLQMQQQLIAEKISAQKQVARAIIHAQETERSEIGKELHDNVCQLLTTSKLYIENAKHCPEQQDTFLKKGVDLLMQSINEIRYLSRQLVSPVHNEGSFEASVGEVLYHYRSLNLFQIDFHYEAGVEQLDKDLKTTIVRILQEALNNTVKYAEASLVTIFISSTADTLRFSYIDNGIGFDPNSAKKGIGLSNIKNRADAYRGKVTVQAEVGKGCSLEIAFPLT